jgi:hypothetical protein
LLALHSETLSEFWKQKVDLSSRNTHLIIFRSALVTSVVCPDP